MRVNFDFSTDKVRALLAFFLVGSFVGMVPLFIFWGMPQTSKEIVTYMMGQLSGMALMLLGNYSTKPAGEDKLNEQRADNTKEAFRTIQSAQTNTGSNVLKDGDSITLEKDNGK